MKLSWLISLVFVLSITISSSLAARRLSFRPLSAQEVYRILKDAGREDAVPEGRIVTQGIAAVSGFALGLKSGIAVPLAIGLATSNATQEFINNINYTALTSSLPTIPPITLPTINYTALTSSLPTINYTALTSSLPTFTLPTLNTTALMNMLKGSSGSSSGSVQFTKQEICFNSRSLNEIDDEDYENADDDVGETVRDYDDEVNLAVSQGRQATPPAATTATGTETAGNPTATTITSPDATNTNTDAGTVTTVDDGDGTDTDTATTTATGTGGSINCVVIQKPSVG